MNIDEMITYAKGLNAMDYLERHYGVNFKREGGNFACNCILPNHIHTGKNTPSLIYNPNKNKLTCFSCNQIKLGDIIDFEGLMNNLSNSGEQFIDILKIIADKEGVELVLKKESDEVIKLKDKKNNLTKLYKENLWKDKNSKAFRFLVDQRMLTEQTITDFHLGCTSKDEYRLRKDMSNISDKIVIPIFSSNGKYVVAHAYRTLTDEVPKYKNDGNDLIFKKSNVLYGLSHTAKYIREFNCAYVVEGYFDLIALYQVGIKNVVACMSNNITEEQLQLIKKYTNNIIFVVDQDVAGQNGVVSNIEKAMNMGFSIRIVDSLNYLGKDANDLCMSLKWDGVAIKNFLISNSKDAVHFLINPILDKFDNVMILQQKKALSIINTILDKVKDEEYKKILECNVKKRLLL